MAKQIRYGDFSKFHPEKMVTAELAVVTSGDPNAESGRSVYVCFVPGVVKRLTTYEDFQMELSSVSEEIRSEFTEDITSSIQNALLATTAANNAAEAAQAATTAANNAAEAAMNYVLGDVSEKTVTFEIATQRAGIESGDSLEIAFGKFAKFFDDIKNYVFYNPVADLESDDLEKPLAASMGKTLDERIGPLVNLPTQNKSNVVNSIKELNNNMTKHWTLFGSGTSVDASSVRNTAFEYLINVSINLTAGYIGNIQFVIPYNSLGTSQIGGYMYDTSYYGTVVLTTTGAKFMIDTSWTRIIAAGSAVNIAPTITVFYR